MSRRALSRGAARALGTKAPSFKPQLADVNTSRLAAFSDKLIGCAGPRGSDICARRMDAGGEGGVAAAVSGR